MKMKNKKINVIINRILLIGFFINCYLILLFAPIEKSMGSIQKIFYPHISAGWLGMVLFICSAIGSILYLITKDKKYTVISLVSVRYGLLFSAINIITGSIWAKFIWNTWLTWDPRLVTVTIMMIMFIVYLMMHNNLSNLNKNNEILSIYLILSAFTVPLVFYSIRMFRTIHPLMINDLSMNLTIKMQIVMFYTLIYMTLLGGVLFINLYKKLIKLEQK